MAYIFNGTISIVYAKAKEINWNELLKSIS